LADIEQLSHLISACQKPIALFDKLETTLFAISECSGKMDATSNVSFAISECSGKMDATSYVSRLDFPASTSFPMFCYAQIMNAGDGQVSGRRPTWVKLTWTMLQCLVNITFAYFLNEKKMKFILHDPYGYVAQKWCHCLLNKRMFIGQCNVVWQIETLVH